ncbi:O-antigen ligase family protein [Halococcus sp. PRR34]|uniref:O-antigen ligase family protein n=1 Tax=Halococcus sp. PRR34 TaxID=3020830 RepID=UPI00235F56D9|nr:O-antigen ligase family protein [Halococcus sp. PRR34]
MVIGAYGMFLVIAVTTHDDFRGFREYRWSNIPVQVHRALLYPTVVLWVVFAAGLVLNPSMRALLRFSAFVGLSAITLFVMPAVVSREHAFTAVGVVGAGCVLLALPSIIWPEYTIAGVEIARVLDSQRSEFTLGIIQRTPASIFDVISYFRILATFGAVCAAGVAAHTRSPWMVAACALNLFGVFLGLGRASILAFVIAAALAVGYLLAGRTALAGMTIAGTLVTASGLAVAFGFLPGPTVLFQSVLGPRVGFWTATYEAFAARPVLGWGLADTAAIVHDFYPGETLTGTHNSYLRLFVVGGIVGGVAYLVLSMSALVLAFRRVCEQTPLALTTFCLVIMALVIQLFTGGTIFGTNLSSVLWALSLAYAQPAMGD